MDQQNVPYQSQPQESTIFQPKPQISPVLMIGGAILVLLVCVGGYYLGIKSKANKTVAIPSFAPTSIVPPTDTRKQIITPMSSVSKAPNIPTDWSLNYNKTCGVSYFLPPSKEPYIRSSVSNSSNLPDELKERKYWTTQEYENESLPFKTAFAIYLQQPSPDIGLGVVMDCADNVNNLTTDLLFRDIQTNYVQTNSQGKVVAKKTMTRWGYQAYVISYLNAEYTNPQDEFYILATPKHIYRISKKEGSNESTVNIEANTFIFDNLKLE